MQICLVPTGHDGYHRADMDVLYVGNTGVFWIFLPVLVDSEVHRFKEEDDCRKGAPGQHTGAARDVSDLFT